MGWARPARRAPKRLAFLGRLRSAAVAGRAWLILQWIDQGSPSSRLLRNLRPATGQASSGHRGKPDWPGPEQLSRLGAANQYCHAIRWSDFFAEHRIGFQLRWATDQGLADANCDATWPDRPGRWTTAGRETNVDVALHGDLWSGNYLCDAEGEPVLIDPAVYYGNREAEFGMLTAVRCLPGTFLRGL